MEGAEKMIRQLSQEPSSYKDLSAALNLHDCPALSGMCQVNYPLQDSHPLSIPTLPVVSAVHTVPLPSELVDRYDPMKNDHCLMGAFPEISQAWLIFDSDLFLWNLQNGQNVICFDGLKDTILCVGLVRPKEGLLQPQISYLLVIATPVKVLMLGVSLTRLQTGILQEGPSEEIQLLTEPLFSVAAEDTYVSVTGTHNGRAFLSGKDGCLYEVVYQATAGWRSPNCQMINHSKSMASVLLTSMFSAKYDPILQIAVDNSRNILYTRSEGGMLQVYDLGHDGNELRKVASVSQDTISSSAMDIAKTADHFLFKPIIQIAVIEKSESPNSHLVAITHAGVRLYFTTAPLQQPTAQPCGLSLVHVRLPPSFTASATVNKPSKVHKVLYSKGVFLMAASTDDVNTLLWCIDHDLIPFRKSLMETHAIAHVHGHTCAIAAITDTSVGMEQDLVPARKFVVLTAYGSHIFSMVRPVDQLQHLLVATYEGVGEQDVERFFKLFHQDQACATSLLLACSTASSDRKLSAWATRAFFRYGGIAQVKINPSPPASNNIRTIVDSPIPMPRNSQVQNPSTLDSNERQHYLPENIFSGGHNGIYMYFTSIINIIWDKELTVERKFKNCDFTEIHSNISSQVVGSVLQDVRGLQDFLDRNFQFGTGAVRDIRYKYKSMIPRGNRAATGTRQKLKNASGKTFTIQDHDVNISYQQELHGKCHTEAQLAEKTSLQGIHQLVRKTCQTLALWRLLCGLHFQQVVSGLDMELQEQLKKTTFKDLVMRDNKLTRALISSLISCHVRGNVEVDGVISCLQQVCPLFYTTEDAIFSKANAHLQRSLQEQNNYDKEQMLRVSLQEYQRICHLVDLASVCGQYRQQCFYEGVVELCLTYAKKMDPRGLGLCFLKNGKPKGDAPGFQALKDRMFSYKIIIDSLQELVNQMKAAPTRVPTRPGPSLQQRSFSNDNSGPHFEQILKVAQRSSDECFHIVLFNWLIEGDLTDALLDLKSPFLEAHLVRISNHGENQVDRMNLLSRYYQKEGNHISAARVIAKLAGNNSTSIPLKVRIEYLSRAIVNARASSVKYVPTEYRQFAHELEDAMDVAKVQLEIQETLIKKYSHHSSALDAVAQLDSRLMDLTDLYKRFAEPFQLSECKLAIIKCACFSNVLLVESIWQEIIERELKDSIERDAADRMQLLNLKLVSLGKIYGNAPMYFPLQFLVHYLERHVCTSDWHVGFVSKTMLEMNVPLSRLFAVYDHLFRYRHPVWTVMKKPLHLLECIHGLLSGYVNDLSSVPSLERSQFSSTCLKAISCYLFELQSMDPTPEVKTSIWTFKHLKTSVEQLKPSFEPSLE